MKNASLKPHLRILHLEDNLRDAELIREHLEAEGMDCEIILVGDRQAFESALDQGVFDLILCDNSLPDYDGLSALVQARTKQPATPFIFVSGTLGGRGGGGVPDDRRDRLYVETSAAAAGAGGAPRAGSAPENPE